LSREFGCTAQTIANWIGAAGGEARRAKPVNDTLSSAEREELVRLRRQVRQVQMERDILAKATAWFAAKGDKTFTPSSSS
jgi:transposase